MTDATTTLDPRTTALLVMDYQPSIIGRLEQSERLLDTAAGAIEAARSGGAHVGYVRVAFEESEIDSVPDHSALAASRPLMRDALAADSEHTQVHDRLAPEEGDIVVRKVRIGAFSTTDLNERLQEKGVDTLVLAGISTSGVVLSTVRDAHDRDYRVLVLADATADPEPGVHEFLTERIFPRQAEVITSAEFAARLAAGE